MRLYTKNTSNLMNFLHFSYLLIGKKRYYNRHKKTRLVTPTEHYFMKKFLFILFAICFSSLLSMYLTAQDSKKIPSVNVKNLKGETLSASSFSNDGKPFIINFWATWCKPCLLELNNISDVYDEWQTQTGVKIIAISIDDSRNSKKVAPFVKGRGWKYEIFLDENSDLRRAMNVNNPPHTFLVNGNGEIVWEHNGYAPGDENILLEEVKKLTNKKDE